MTDFYAKTELVKNSSQSYEFDTLDDLIGNNITFVDVKLVSIKDTLGSWTQSGLIGQTPSQSPSDLVNSLVNDALGNQWKLVHSGTIFLSKLGATPSLSDSLPIVTAAIQAIFEFGGGDVVATKLYNMENRAVLKNNVYIRAIKGTGAGFKATATNPSTDGKLFGAVSGVSNWALIDLVLDGNSSNNASLTPLIQSFDSEKWRIQCNDIINSAGIAINVSTDNFNVKILDNDFFNIGFTTGVGGDDAKQCIAFSSGGHKEVHIKDNGFRSIGLDCISIGGIDGGVISNNYHDDDNCYALIFNDPALPSSRLSIDLNRAKTAVNVVGSIRPEGLGFDFPAISNSIISNNTAINCASAGLAIFSGCFDLTVTGNVTIDCNQSGDGIHDAGIIVRLTTGIITLSGNTSKNNIGSTQLHGLLMDDNQSSNIIVDGSNYFEGSSSLGVAAATFTGPTDVGTIQYQFDIPKELRGVGTPEASIFAPKNSTFVNTSGGAGLVNYRKETDKSSNTGWVLD